MAAVLWGAPCIRQTLGLKEGLGAKHAQMIVETATYETGALTIDS